MCGNNTWTQLQIHHYWCACATTQGSYSTALLALLCSCFILPCSICSTLPCPKQQYYQQCCSCCQCCQQSTLLIFHLSIFYDVHVMTNTVMKRHILVGAMYILYFDTKLSGLELLSSRAAVKWASRSLLILKTCWGSYSSQFIQLSKRTHESANDTYCSETPKILPTRSNYEKNTKSCKPLLPSSLHYVTL